MIYALILIILISLLLQSVKKENKIEKFEEKVIIIEYEFFFKEKCYLCDIVREKYWNNIKVNALDEAKAFVEGAAQEEQQPGVAKQVSVVERNVTKEWYTHRDTRTKERSCRERYKDAEAKNRAVVKNITHFPTILIISPNSRQPESKMVIMEDNNVVVKDRNEFKRRQKIYDEEKLHDFIKLVAPAGTENVEDVSYNDGYDRASFIVQCE